MFYLFMVLGVTFSSIGSFRSIRKEWHHEEYYRKYVRPSYMYVVAFTSFITVTFSYFCYNDSLSAFIPNHTFLIVLITIIDTLSSYIIAFLLGTLIYSRGNRNDRKRFKQWK
jgi:pilus assembly protein TadC